ncbi:hypothetical protein VIBR0546_02484 [Vibrio brasiliensis LMG 20546]|uniref:Uncharacterized protein n=2 Tax=Vibrio brasiliensis TaxID=170652 RepID=E8LYQ3_9VIBR|nr:hypothetical protein VIBR0546_02484 [Vibrio brasiliensis LMG 20546]
MIYLEAFDAEKFRQLLSEFKPKLKMYCLESYPSEYERKFRSASDGCDDLITALERVSHRDLNEIKAFLEAGESLLIREKRGMKVKTSEYRDELETLIPLQTTVRVNDTQNRLHNFRLFVSFLAMKNVVRLNCLVGSHPKSVKAAERISASALRQFVPPLAVDFWIGASVNRHKELQDHIQTSFFKESYLRFIDAEVLSIDKLGEAFRRIADIIVANGITSVSDISLECLLSYHDDLMEYYQGSPAAYNLRPAFDFLVMAGAISSSSFYDEFTRQRAAIQKTKPQKNVQVYDSSSSKCISYIGANVQNVKEVRVPSNDRKVVLDYGYWSDTSGTDAAFHSEKLDQNNIWIAAQQDFIRSTSGESGTVKQKNSRLSILNKYLFSYLPAYFKSGLSGSFTYPASPNQLIHSLFVQRSNVYEVENRDKFTENFQYPVPLQQFVYDMTASASKLNTKNNNSGRDALAVISSFFDFLAALDSDLVKDFKNPLDGSAKKKVGKRYAKNRKYVFSLNYWLGLRSFCKLITNQMLDEVANDFKTGQDSKDYINVCQDVNIEGDSPMNIGRVSLESFKKVKLIKREEQRGLNGVKDLNVYITDFIPWAMMTLLLHSGLRRANALWLDDRECFSLVTTEDQAFQTLLVSTDKAKTEPFPIVLTSEIMAMLQKVSVTKKAFVESNPTLGEAIPYKGYEDSKWGKISPLFRIKNKHDEVACRHYFNEIINEYEAFLSRNAIEFQPTTLYAPQLHYQLDEFVHLVNDINFDTRHCEIAVDYWDVHEAASFVPIAKKTQISPHSLRTMSDSIFAPILGADVVGKLMSGQSEETVGYYTKELPDSASKDFINEVIEYLSIDKSTTPIDLVTVKEAEVDQASFEDDLKESPTATVNKYNARSVNFGATDDGEVQLNGLMELNKATPNCIAYYRTHICPVSGDCPKKVINEIGEKKCFACPLAVVTNNHLPAIVATIRSLCDQIKTKNTYLEHFDMLETEKDELENQRADLIAEASYWEARRAIAEESGKNGEIYYVSKEGLEIMRTFNPAEASEQARLCLRLRETEGIPKLHSEKLKLQALRLRRKIQLKAKDSHAECDVMSDIEYVAQVFNLKSDLQGITNSEKLKLLLLEEE